MTEKSTILVVDDVPQNILLLNSFLKDEYKIIYSTSGAEALKIAEQIIPDLVLLDIMMPEMNGYEVLKKMKENENLKEIPVIFVTALGDASNESEGLKLGAIDYIRKPFDKEVIRLRIKNHMELKKARDRLYEFSNIDKLTDIPNRRALEENLEKESLKAIRENRPIGILMIDIDLFKIFNDSFGHLEGDNCLKLLAKTIKENLLRPGDMVGRFGGEEFMCLLPETEEGGILEVAERIRKSVENLSIPHGEESPIKVITVSIGAVSAIPRKNQTIRGLIDFADKALYESKNTGRNKVTLWVL